MIELDPKIKESCIDFSKQLSAGGATWKDSTNYSRFDEDRIPTCFDATVGDCRITILCNHRHNPGAWVFHCYKLGIETRALDVETAQQAAEKAIKLCEEITKKMYDDFLALGLITKE